MSNDLIDETREAMAMLKTVIEFEPATDRIIKDASGHYHAGKTEPFIKLGLGFRDELSTCKGAPLAVFLSICLHVNENGKAWPSIKTICKETGYETEAVAKAIRSLRDTGLIRVTPRKGYSSVYEPVFAAYGRGIVKGLVSGIDGGTRKTENPSPGKTGVVPPRKTETEEEPYKKNQQEEPISADAQSLAPSGGADSKRARRDALDIQASFEAYKAKGRAAGADQTAAAHPMAGRWPHLVAHCRAFEDASGMDARNLTPSALKAWAGQFEDHLRAAVTADDEKTLVNMARSKRWDVLQPKSVTSLIGAMRAKPAAAAAEQAAQPLY